PRPAEPVRLRHRRAGAGHLLCGWRSRADDAGAAARGDRHLPGHAAVLPPRCGRVRPLPAAAGGGAGAGRSGMSPEFLVALVYAIVLVATPILLAGLGELVVEKSGVLTLGVEGMMLIGAVTGFAVTSRSGNPDVGV